MSETRNRNDLKNLFYPMTYDVIVFKSLIESEIVKRMKGFRADQSIEFIQFKIVLALTRIADTRNFLCEFQKSPVTALSAFLRKH